MENEQGVDHLAAAFLACRAMLARLVGRVVKPHDIEDIVQETFIRSFEAARRQPIRHPRSFMFRTAYNLAISHVRRAEGRTTTSVADFSSFDVFTTAQTPESELEASERFQLFCRAIRDLPRQCRRVFLLKRVCGFSQREIAAMLNLSESTVEKHIGKGLLMCRDYMAAHGSGVPQPKRVRSRTAA